MRTILGFPQRYEVRKKLGKERFLHSSPRSALQNTTANAVAVSNASEAPRKYLTNTSRKTLDQSFVKTSSIWLVTPTISSLSQTER